MTNRTGSASGSASVVDKRVVLPAPRLQWVAYGRDTWRAAFGVLGAPWGLLIARISTGGRWRCEVRFRVDVLARTHFDPAADPVDAMAAAEAYARERMAEAFGALFPGGLRDR